MAAASTPRIAVLGAGSIGAFVGGCWRAAGLDVTLIGRPWLAEEVAAHGLTLSDERGWRQTLRSPIAIEPAPLADANLILVAVKSGALDAAARDIADHARADAVVVSLLNGVDAADRLRAVLGAERAILRGMVAFNVAHLGEGRFHKGVAGAVWAEDHPALRPLAARLNGSPAALRLTRNMVGVQWGKLLINLNNAVNALSGLPLRAQLEQRGYRRVVAASMREGLVLLRVAGITPARVGPLPPALVPLVLEAPDGLFNATLIKLQRIDRHARSSMADDLAAGRTTEIDALTGELVRLATRLGRAAPVNTTIVQLVRDAEGGGRRAWGAGELANAVLG